MLSIVIRREPYGSRTARRTRTGETILPPDLRIRFRRFFVRVLRSLLAPRGFWSEALPPKRTLILADPALTEAERLLVAALFDRNRRRAGQIIEATPGLLRRDAPVSAMLLTVAVASADPRLVALLLDQGAPPDGTGDGAPLHLALEARSDRMARLLLERGASPTPPDALVDLFRSVIAHGATDRVTLLLLHTEGPDPCGPPHWRRPLHIALDMEKFRVAELLVAQGADIWALDTGGCNLGSAVMGRTVTFVEEEDAARQRLAALAARVGWPDPAPDPFAVRRLALAGDWPPFHARAAGAQPPRREILDAIAANARWVAGRQAAAKDAP